MRAPTIQAPRAKSPISARVSYQFKPSCLPTGVLYKKEQPTRTMVRAIQRGPHLRALPKKSFCRKIFFLIGVKMRKAMPAARNGEIIQDRTTPPSFIQFTTDGPPATMPNPRIAPTMECVLDTGSAVSVAMSTHAAAAKSEANIPSRII